MSEFETARLNMVESQVRPSDVTDRRIIAAMAHLPREEFIPGRYSDLAYMDRDVLVSGDDDPAGQRHVPAARVFAKLVQLCDIEADDLVLEIGAATGYGTAVLASLAATVVGLECESKLAKQATDNLIGHDIANTAIVDGPLEEGYPSQGPYDVILLEGCVPEVPQTLFDQLKSGGRLVAVVGENGTGKANVYLRHDETIGSREAFDANMPQLKGFQREQSFVF